MHKKTSAQWTLVPNLNRLHSCENQTNETEPRENRVGGISESLPDHYLVIT